MYQKSLYSYFYEGYIPGYQYHIASYPGILGWNFCHFGDPCVKIGPFLKSQRVFEKMLGNGKMGVFEANAVELKSSESLKAHCTWDD